MDLSRADPRASKLIEMYKGHRHFGFVEKIAASMCRNQEGQTPKKVLCGLYEFFQEHKVFINELKAVLIELKVKI